MPSQPRVVYKYSRLTFHRDSIEPLRPGDSFRVETPAGTFQMTKAQFYEAFPNVVQSWSYQENGYYNYPRVPESAGRFVVEPESSSDGVVLIPEEVPHSQDLYEGALQAITVNAYERNQTARRQCIRHYGLHCFVCRILMAQRYGEVASTLIHVHHLKELSRIRAEYRVDPVRDLRPVCPNCHAVIHMRTPPCSIQEARALLKESANQAL